MDIIDAIVIFLLGCFVGHMYTVWTLRGAIRELADEYGVILDSVEPPKKVVRILHTERIKDMLYLYDEDNSFICQACTLKELAERVKELDYAKIAGVVDGESQLWFINGNVYNNLDEVEVQ
jgi:hypothetical protein